MLFCEALLWERDDVLPDGRNEVEYTFDEICSLPGGQDALWDDILDVLTAGHAEDVARDRKLKNSVYCLYCDYFSDGHGNSRCRPLPPLPAHMDSADDVLDWTAAAVEESGIMPLLRAFFEKGVPAEDLVA